MAGRGPVVSTPADVAAAADARAIEDVVGPLAAFSRDLPMRVQVAAGWKPDKTAAVWAVGEVAPGDDWKTGGEPGARSFRVALTSSSPLAAGDYAVRIRARGAAATAIALNEVVRLALPHAPEEIGAICVRRGPATGNKDVATADLRFRRSEHIRVEVPSTSPAVSARLLDRTGKVLAVPLTAAVREDADGSRWQTAELALAPLAVGDYVIELAGGAGGERKRTLVAFRIVP